MASKAMNSDSDSQNQLPYSWSDDDRPPLQFTPAGFRELYDSIPTLAIPVPFSQGEYTCPFCNGECSRNYCSWCFSSLLDQDE